MIRRKLIRGETCITPDVVVVDISSACSNITGETRNPDGDIKVASGTVGQTQMYTTCSLYLIALCVLPEIVLRAWCILQTHCTSQQH